MNFPENLKKYREAAGYKTAKDFAAAMGIRYTTYVGYEKGSYEPNYETLCAIAQKLGVSVDELVGNAPPPTLERYLRIARGAGYEVRPDEEMSGYFGVCYSPSPGGIYAAVHLPESDVMKWIERSLEESRRRADEQFPAVLSSVLNGILAEKFAALKSKPDEK